MSDNVKRLCSYLVNARKKPKKKKHDNKYSYNVRYYFTSAKIVSLSATQSSEIASNIQAKRGSQFSYMGEYPDSTMIGGATNLRGDAEDRERLMSGAGAGQATKIMDTMGMKIRDTVALVCLGDSRGFVHMNHLILK